MSDPSVPKRARKEVRLGKNPDVVYCEEDRIGQGQFGTVYRGRSLPSNTVVAVKLLRDIPSATASETASPHHTRATNTTTTTGRAQNSLDAAAHSPTDSTTRPPSPPARARAKVPLELELLWALRADGCPNIVHVLSVWNKPRKHHPPAHTNTQAAGGGESSATRRGVGSLPSSPSVTDLVQRQTSVYVLVTEYCEGGDLQHRLQALETSVPTRVARSLIYQLCNALYTLKRRRIVHRDIKPANLLLSSRDWETATLKVADFGMAKAAHHQAHTTAAVAGGEGVLVDTDGDAAALPSNLFYSEMGTPMYMSPERIAGQPYDYKADVYSAGMVLLEMMRGSCVRVTRVSQLRTIVPETIQRMRGRYVAKGEAVPAWLELVQRMTATDPAQRCSVEEVLRHPWFAPEAGPPLPPLTFPLPPEAPRVSGAKSLAPSPPSPPVEAEAPGADDAQQRAAELTAADDESTSTAVAQPSSDASVSLTATATTEEAGGAVVAVVAAPSVPSPSPEPPLSQAATVAPGHDTHDTLCTETSAAVGEKGRRLSAPRHWVLLGVCPTLDVRDNSARCVYTGPSLKAKNRSDNKAAHPGPASLPAPTGTGTGCPPSGSGGSSSSGSGGSTTLTLPPACGPHVVTSAVRGFVDAVYLYALQDELDPVAGLTIISFLVELVQNGFGAYVQCLESLEGGNGGSTSDATAMAGAADSAVAVVVGGRRLVVREFGALRDVWQTLMRRLTHAQAAYTAQLPPRMLHSAALWRQRVLRSSGGDACGVDGEERWEEGAEQGRCAALDASTTSSEGDAAMPGLPNVASITNVAGASAQRPQALSSSRAAPSTGAAGGSGAAPLRVHTATTRAEQLIFAKAVDCIQSDALSRLLADPPTVAERAALSTRLLPPHRGIALLRVLLQRAVLSAADVGLEPEAAAAARSPSLGFAASPPAASTAAAEAAPLLSSAQLHPFAEAATAAAAEDAAAMQQLFVVQVPVYATLQQADTRVVENLLCTATRAFSVA